MIDFMILEQFKLTNKVALVTGGNRGLGQAMAIGLAQAGAFVFITSRSGKADETLAQIRKDGGDGAVIQADFLQDDGRDIVNSVVEKNGRIDILINNAGTIRRGPALEFSEDDWSTVVDVNLNAVWKLSQAAAQKMAAQGGGKIINNASVLGYQGGLTVPSYTATKHAIIGLTRALANEWASQNINVNAIAPGYFKTDMTDSLQTDPNRSEQILARIPAGYWGDPSDLAGTAVYLASNASRYVHGQVVVVDGGWLSR